MLTKAAMELLKVFYKPLYLGFCSCLHVTFITITIFLVISSSYECTQSGTGPSKPKETEAISLLTWKMSLDKHSQSRLLSWDGSSPCNNNWTGIGCNEAGSITHINLAKYDLKELAYTMEVNAKNDVYSFGVLSLEVIMGKHPGDFVSSFSSLILSSSSSSSSSSFATRGMLLNDLLDQRLSPPTNQLAGETAFLMKLAFACLHPNPNCRPNMQQVSVQLTKERNL